MNKGTLRDYVKGQSIHFINNSDLIFAASIAYAAPLIDLLGVPGGGGGGFNFVGASNGLLKLVAAISGHPNSIVDAHIINKPFEETCVDYSYRALPVVGSAGVFHKSKVINSINTIISGEGRIINNSKGTAIPQNKWKALLITNLDKEIKGINNFYNIRGNIIVSDELLVQTNHNYGVAMIGYLEALKGVKQESLIKGLKNCKAKIGDDLLALVALGGELATILGITRWGIGNAAQSAIMNKPCVQ